MLWSVRLLDPKNIMEVIRAVTMIVTVCTVITALTPSKSDDKIMQQINHVLNVLAGNVLHNKNADDPSCDCNKTEQTESSENVTNPKVG